MEALREPPTLSPPVEAYISADEFWDMSNSPEYADSYSELIEGRVIEMPRPKHLHGYVATQLGVALAIHVMAHSFGTVYTSEMGYVLERRPTGRDTVRGIDISYVSNDRLPDQVANDWIEGAPDLAVEVLSPSNLFSDILLKKDQLLNAGARAVWIVDPKTRSLQIYSAHRVSQNYNEGDVLSGGDILPGFSIKLADIFPA